MFSRPVRFILKSQTARRIDEIQTLNDARAVLFKPGAGFRFRSTEFNADLGRWIMRSKELK